MKSIQEYLRQLLQTVSQSKMLAIHLCLDVLFVHLMLCLDVLFVHLMQSANNQVQDASQTNTLHHPNSITKAMDGLFKYIGNCT